MKKVLVVGELNVDVLLNHIGGMPVVGKEILADEMVLTLGSSSAIFAANLSALGVEVSFCGMVGKDAFGEMVLSALRAKGVDTSLVVESPDVGTGATVVLNYGQDRANVTYCGAMQRFGLVDMPLDVLSGFDHLHFSSYFLQKGFQRDIVRLFAEAKEKGLTTSLDIQWDPAERWDFPYRECLPLVDVFLPNESELLALTGASSVEDACEALAPYAQLVVVKRGAEGATAVQSGMFTSVEAFVNHQLVDAIGAGDSFNAGFIKCYLQDGSLVECLRMGNLAGAVNTTAAGGTGAFSTPEDFREMARTIFNIDIP